jgi:DNA-binding CsgD family transcriptional regulator
MSIVSSSAEARRRRKNNACQSSDDPGATRQREMIAELCRFMGEQLTGRKERRVLLSGILQSADDHDLPRRVRQTLDRMLAGDSEKQIALRLGISRHTVHVYVKTLYRRYAVSSRGELIARLIGTLNSSGEALAVRASRPYRDVTR